MIVSHVFHSLLRQGKQIKALEIESLASNHKSHLPFGVGIPPGSMSSVLALCAFGLFQGCAGVNNHEGKPGEDEKRQAFLRQACDNLQVLFFTQ